MTERAILTRVFRGLWFAIGGAWGAWVGFGGYSGISWNPDSFASLLAYGFYIAFALFGLLAGMAVGGAVGYLVDYVMRRLGAGTVAALVLATLASLCAVRQVSSLVLGRYAMLRAPVARTAAGVKALPRSSCTSPAPSDAMARKSWEAECRGF